VGRHRTREAEGAGIPGFPETVSIPEVVADDPSQMMRRAQISVVPRGVRAKGDFGVLGLLCLLALNFVGFAGAAVIDAAVVRLGGPFGLRGGLTISRSKPKPHCGKPKSRKGVWPLTNTSEP